MKAPYQPSSTNIYGATANPEYLFRNFKYYKLMIWCLNINHT